MIGAIIGGAMGLANMIGGGIKSAKENRRQRKLIEEEKAAAENAYKRDYYGNYLDRSEVRSLLKRAREVSKDRMNNARATAAVMGSTPEVAVAQQQAEANAYGNVVSGLGANADTYKDMAQRRYDDARRSILNQELGYARERGANYSNMIANGANAIAGSLGVPTTGNNNVVSPNSDMSPSANGVVGNYTALNNMLNSNRLF